jgi:glycerophosphoryl diester phosphodiesterase
MPSTEIIAHRGASHECPENTLSAFVRAVELGAEGVELDVHLTADLVLVVHHDAVPHDPPNAGLAGRDIGSMTFEELSRFRVGAESIPTLEAVIRGVNGRAIIYCELKGPQTAAAAVALLKPLGTNAAVHSFDHRQIAAAHQLAPDVARGVLEASYHISPTFSMESVAARDLWMAAELIDRDLVDAVHAHGGRLCAWTVDAPDEMQRLARLGIDGLCTNDVALCKKVLGR